MMLVVSLVEPAWSHQPPGSTWTGWLLRNPKRRCCGFPEKGLLLLTSKMRACSPVNYGTGIMRNLKKFFSPESGSCTWLPFTNKSMMNKERFSLFFNPFSCLFGEIFLDPRLYVKLFLPNVHIDIFKQIGNVSGLAYGAVSCKPVSYFGVTSV